MRSSAEVGESKSISLAARPTPSHPFPHRQLTSLVASLFGAQRPHKSPIARRVRDTPILVVAVRRDPATTFVVLQVHRSRAELPGGWWEWRSEGLMGEKRAEREYGRKAES